MGAILALLSCFTVYYAWTMLLLLVLDHNKTLLGLRKSYRKSMSSYSLYRSSNFFPSCGTITPQAIPTTTSIFCLSSIAWRIVSIHSNSRHTAVIPLQTTYQAWIHPRLGTTSPSAMPYSGDNITFKHQQELGTPADLIVLCSRVRLCCISIHPWGEDHSPCCILPCTICSSQLAFQNSLNQGTHNHPAQNLLHTHFHFMKTCTHFPIPIP